ncbi:extracellular solute-binding protein [Virgibacillus halophilus]|uniref:Extracellular solute-binding protein n=1 Tax=Tigheibacillus halophilus TaxID=361280 RepID=A0ABU5C3D3_9BACI|nr:extracellular solute-binding protein [Virgibacillus halophilus]
MQSCFITKINSKKAGLDPENPPKTFSEMKDAAKKLATDGNYGFTMATIGWFVEELMANQGALYLDNDNGRSEDAAKALVNTDEGVAIFKWLNEMNKAGSFKNYGSNWEDPRAPFFAGQVGMYFDSTANTAEVIKNSSFDVGTAPLPVADGKDPQGLIVGGSISVDHQPGS